MKYVDKEGNRYGIGGPNEITGNFTSREKLEAEVRRLKAGKYSQRHIADKCGVSESIITNILKKPDTVTDFALLRHKVLRTLWSEINLEVRDDETDIEGVGQVGQGEEVGDCKEG